MKTVIFWMLGMMACGCVLAQSVQPAGPDRFRGIAPAMPAPAQIVTTTLPTQALPSTTRILQGPPRMPAPHEIVTEVPPALRKQEFGSPRQASPSETVQQDPPLRAVDPEAAAPKR